MTSLKRLPEHLDKALRVIANNDREGIDVAIINNLIESSYIKHKYDGGWMLSSKGRLYLKEHKTAL